MGGVWGWISGKIRTCSDTKYDVCGWKMDGGKGNKPTAQDEGARLSARLRCLSARMEGL